MYNIYQPKISEGMRMNIFKAVDFQRTIRWIDSSEWPDASAAVAAPIRKLWDLINWDEQLAHERDADSCCRNKFLTDWSAVWKLKKRSSGWHTHGHVSRQVKAGTCRWVLRLYYYGDRGSVMMFEGRERENSLIVAQGYLVKFNQIWIRSFRLIDCDFTDV
jgi:hypothetical protein